MTTVLLVGTIFCINGMEKDTDNNSSSDTQNRNNFSDTESDSELDESKLKRMCKMIAMIAQYETREKGKAQ